MMSFLGQSRARTENGANKNGEVRLPIKASTMAKLYGNDDAIMATIVRSSRQIESDTCLLNPLCPVLATINPAVTAEPAPRKDSSI